MKKIVLAISLLIMGILAGWLYYNKPHRTVTDESAIAIKAMDLFDNFQNNETLANNNYLNKILEVNGKVGNLSTNAEGFQVLMLESADPIFGINCTMDSNNEKLVIGDSVTLKGICTGFLSDVILVQCQIQGRK